MSWAFVYLFPVAGPVLGVLSGTVAVLLRGALGYRRTAGYLRFLLSRISHHDPNDLSTPWLLLAEFAFFAGLGVVFLLTFLAVGFTVGLPPFYGALGYSTAAIRALTLFSLAFGVGAAAVILFFSEPADRAAYLGAPSILGLLVGTVSFGVAARATFLMFLYPDAHHEVGSRTTTRLPFGWLLDILPLPSLGTVALVLFLVAWITRRLDTRVRPWHVLLLLAIAAYLLTYLVLWLYVKWSLGPMWASSYSLLTQTRALGALAFVLAGVEYNVEMFTTRDG